MISPEEKKTPLYKRDLKNMPPQPIPTKEEGASLLKTVPQQTRHGKLNPDNA